MPTSARALRKLVPVMLATPGLGFLACDRASQTEEGCPAPSVNGETSPDDAYGVHVYYGDNVSVRGSSGAAGLWVGFREQECPDTDDTGPPGSADDTGDCVDDEGCVETSAAYLLQDLDLCAATWSSGEYVAACSSDFGRLVGVAGDLDGDDLSDVVVYNINTAEAQFLSSQDCSTVLLRVPACVGFVHEVAAPTGEGATSPQELFLLNGSVRAEDGSWDYGVWLLPVDTRGELSTDDLTTRVTLSSDDNVEATALSDVTGDGLLDAVLLLPGSETSAVAIAPGPMVFGSDLTVDPRVTGRGRYALLSVGDLDGDGYADLAVAHRYNEEEGVDPVVAVLFGPFGDDGSLDEAPLRIEEIPDPSGEPTSIVLGGDVTGDGAPDLAIGVDQFDATEANVGAVWLFSGRREGILSPTDADARVVGDTTDGLLGLGLAFADVTGDGQLDLAISGTTSMGDLLLFEGR